MPRDARIVVPGLPHHVTHRGNHRDLIFKTPKDRRIYWRLLRKAVEEYAIRVWNYCLMPNHVHVIAVPEYRESLAEAFGDAHGTYTELFNAKYGVVGHLWQGRFKSYVMDESHLWNAARYVERNPVRAGLVRRAEDYSFSSAPSHCGLRRDPLLSPDLPLLPKIENWAEWLHGEESDETLKAIRRHAARGLPCGSPEFLRKILKEQAS